jgi:DNA repair exonuclease SbcCD ATPase subunit
MLLVARGFLSKEQLEAALDEQLTTGRRLGEILVERGFIPHSTLSFALAEQYGIHPSVERGFGSGLRVLLGLRSDDDPEPEAALPEISTVEEPEVPAVTHLEARLEEQWARLAAVQEQLAATEERLRALQRQHDRRRAQAVRLLGGLRAQRSAHLAVLEQLAMAAQDLHSLHRSHERRRAQADRLLARLRAERPAQRVVQERLATAEEDLHLLHRRHERRRAQAVRLLARLRVQQPAQLAAVQEQLATTEEQLHAATRLHERRHAQAGRLLARLRAQRPDDRDEGAVGSHLLFLQLGRGYELLERDGRPPAPDAQLELADFPESVFVVTSLGRSPLPNDRRSCAFAQPVSRRALH